MGVCNVLVHEYGCTCSGNSIHLYLWVYESQLKTHQHPPGPSSPWTSWWWGFWSRSSVGISFIQSKLQVSTAWSQMLFLLLGVIWVLLPFLWFATEGIIVRCVNHDVAMVMCVTKQTLLPPHLEFTPSPCKFLPPVLISSSHCGDLSYGNFILCPCQYLRQATVPF